MFPFFHAANLFINFTYVWIYIHTFSYTANLNISLCASRAELIFPMNHTWTLVILFDCFEQSGNLLFWLHWKNWSLNYRLIFIKINKFVQFSEEKKVTHFKCLHELNYWDPIFIAKTGNFFLKYFIYWLLEAIFKKKTHTAVELCIKEEEKNTSGEKINKNRFFITKQKKNFFLNQKKEKKINFNARKPIKML